MDPKINIEYFTDEFNIYANKCLITYLTKKINDYINHPIFDPLDILINTYIDYFFNNILYYIIEDKYIYECKNINEKYCTN